MRGESFMPHSFKFSFFGFFLFLMVHSAYSRADCDLNLVLDPKKFAIECKDSAVVEHNQYVGYPWTKGPVDLDAHFASRMRVLKLTVGKGRLSDIFVDPGVADLV